MLSEFPFLYRFTVLLNSGGSNSPWSEFWSEFPLFMGMGVAPAPSKNQNEMFLTEVHLNALKLWTMAVRAFWGHGMPTVE